MAAQAQFPVHLICDASDEELVRGRIIPLFQQLTVRVVVLETALAIHPAEGEVVCLYLDDGNLARILPRAIIHKWLVTCLPHPDLIKAAELLGVGVTLPEAVDHITTILKEAGTEARLDVLFCNALPVFHSVVIGEALMDPPAWAGKPLVLPHVGRFLRILVRATRWRPQLFTLITAQEKRLDTAALGIVVVEQGRSSLFSRRILDASPSNDGMANALVIAPRSIMEMVFFLLASLVPGRGVPASLPPFLGHIKAQALRIQAEEAMDFTLDGTAMSARELVLHVAPRALRVIPGPGMLPRETKEETKERFKVQSLPLGRARGEMAGAPLPWLRRAATEEFKDLFLALKNNARASSAYLTLMLLSTMLATLGLFANSTPVIIGAMILAPLMSPIIALAMGVTRHDEGLMIDSSWTLFWGMLVAVGTATLATLLIPLSTVNMEIAARLSPNLLDLGVALVSGVAGAFAHAREDIAKSLAGVAIAVALVPPLAVVGIGIGWQDWMVFFGAALLFLTNLVGIVFAASITFLLLGFAPFHRARRGLLISLLLAGIVSVPLFMGFLRVVEEQRIIRTLDGWEPGEFMVQDVSIRHGEPLAISVRIIAPEPVSMRALDAMKAEMENMLNRRVSLEAQVVIVR